MNTTGLNPAGNDLLQAIGRGGLPALEVVAASGDTFPPLKAAVVEALAVIGIVQVCVLTSIILLSVTRSLKHFDLWLNSTTTARL